MHRAGCLWKISLVFFLLASCHFIFIFISAKYHALKLPTVVLACKSDLPRQVDPQFALEVIQQYDAGLVEVTNSTDAGKEKMRRSFQWLLKAVRVDQRESHLSIFLAAPHS